MRLQATPRTTSLVSSARWSDACLTDPIENRASKFEWSNSPKDQEDKTANEMRPRVCWSCTIREHPSLLMPQSNLMVKLTRCSGGSGLRMTGRATPLKSLPCCNTARFYWATSHGHERISNHSRPTVPRRSLSVDVTVVLRVLSTRTSGHIQRRASAAASGPQSVWTNGHARGSGGCRASKVSVLTGYTDVVPFPQTTIVDAPRRQAVQLTHH